MRTLMDPSSFEEGQEADEVTDCIDAYIARTLLSGSELLKDDTAGGGFTQTLVAATGGSLHCVTVVGPYGEAVEAHYGLLGDEVRVASGSEVPEGTPTSEDPRTAVLEMAAAVGPTSVSHGARSRLGTTTYGLGELVRAALDAGAERVIVGCGDSGTTDGGAGMAQALGARLLDSSGEELGWGGVNLVGLDRIELDGLDPRTGRTRIDIGCDLRDVLCGPEGVARTFRVREGASPEIVEWLSHALENYARVVLRDLGSDVRRMPGGGVSGGLGAGLHAFLGANFLPPYEIARDNSA